MECVNSKFLDRPKQPHCLSKIFHINHIVDFTLSEPLSVLTRQMIAAVWDYLFISAHVLDFCMSFSFENVNFYELHLSHSVLIHTETD